MVAKGVEEKQVEARVEKEEAEATKEVAGREEVEVVVAPLLRVVGPAFVGPGKRQVDQDAHGDVVQLSNCLGHLVDRLGALPLGIFERVLAESSADEIRAWWNPVRS